MAVVLPPPPIGSPPGSFEWTQWYLALQQLYAGTGTVPWDLIDTSGSDIQDIVSRAHNNLQSMQGGTSGEFYHLTSAQHTSLTSLPTLAAGTYTPTLTNVTNLDSSTAYEAQYIRIGGTITVSGNVVVIREAEIFHAGPLRVGDTLGRQAKRTAAIGGRCADTHCHASPRFSEIHSPPVVEPIARRSPLPSTSRACR